MAQQIQRRRRRVRRRAPTGLGSVASLTARPNPTLDHYEGWKIAAPMAITLFGLIPAGAAAGLAQILLSRRMAQAGATHVSGKEWLTCALVAGVPLLTSIFLIRTFIRE